VICVAYSELTILSNNHQEGEFWLAILPTGQEKTFLSLTTTSSDYIGQYAPNPGAASGQYETEMVRLKLLSKSSFLRSGRR
jgi:hypothetical protein